MGKFTGKMIISDLDGTLIPRGGVISAENRAAIQSFVAEGGRFAVATGRTPEAAKGYVEGLPINAPSVFFNGAMLYDWGNGKVLKTLPLTAGDADNLWPAFAQKCLRTFPDACFEIYTADNCHVITPADNDDPRLPHEYYRYAHTNLEKLTDTVQTPWLKFFACDKHEHLEEYVKLAEQMGTAALANGFYSEDNYYEFVARDVSKGAMTAAIREQLPGIEIIACGDYLNDNEMLAEADIGVAPANAHEETKKMAQYIGCNVEKDLLAWVIQEIL
ncbi:MAG: HAD-IIB family hydrolase [Selenomonas sp.]|uniref:HAD-IIB family hydrolase n=1 Tax=Selenomonas sp. TaxID=2053611 RepID=UPI0025ED9FD6|nr:HAD-IIB family hydrolase [Selenomonas sp.]MCR5758658.1 HAD-IIB family hydrolase [Selenomonas sp.]